MEVILLGTGTSQGVPIIGCQCVTCISSDSKDKRLRTSAYINIDGYGIIIDVGPDFRQQMLTHHIHRVDAVLLTHEHNDHVIGLDDIRPFNFMHQVEMPVYGLKRVINDIKIKFGYVFEENPYPGAPRMRCYEIEPYKNYDLIEGITIQTLHVMHGDLPIVGYRIGPFGYVTDCSFLDDISIEILKGVDVLVLDCLRYREHYSHFNYIEAIQTAKKINAHQTYLTHMSHEMGLHRDIVKNAPDGILPGFDGLKIKL